MTTLGLYEGRPRTGAASPPVHYQISVTGRQAGFFFLLLLARARPLVLLRDEDGRRRTKGPGAAAAVSPGVRPPGPDAPPAEGLRETRSRQRGARIRPEEKAERRPRSRGARGRPAPRRRPDAVPPAPTVASAGAPKPASAPKPAPKGPFYVQVLATKKAPRRGRARGSA